VSGRRASVSILLGLSMIGALAMVLSSAPHNLSKVYQGQFSSITKEATSLKLLDWNIERGLQMAGIGAAIEREKPDICILQEVDLNARRTGHRNVAEELARKFQLNYVFGVEFQELSQGSRDAPAYHGQALLSALPIRSSINRTFGSHAGICPTGRRFSADWAGAWLWWWKSRREEQLSSFTTPTWRVGGTKIYDSCNWKRFWRTPKTIGRTSL
jgi:Endonuclease/Exonuclease/phosphatase family